jgi:signal transduction histidine kinase
VRRFVRFLVVSKELDRFDLESDPIASEMTSEIIRMKEDSLLMKLRIFSSPGKVVYSTQTDEIGNINKNDYFTQQVARGKIYSKVVAKDHLTADGVLVKRDVVETYVPIMVAGRFHGAVEIYYDITTEQARLHELNKNASSLLLFYSAAFVLLMVLGLNRAKLSFLAMKDAENSLQIANETLENRVAQRTGQLQAVNEKLTTEIQVRQRAESALQAALASVSDARDKIDTILSSVADALIVTDEKDRVVHMNPVAERYFQINSWQVDVSFPQLVNLPGLVENIAEAKNQLAEGEIAEFDLTLSPGGNSAPRILAARASRLLSEYGEQRGMVIFLQDATKVRNVERMKSEFVSIAAHELRTPLTMILGYSELMLENRTFSEAEIFEFLGIINSKAADLSSIVDDLLDVTRIEEGRPLELYLDKIDFGLLISRAVSEVDQRDNGAHEIILAIPTEPCVIPADQGRMQQVLENLLNNAVKYSPDGGDITIHLCPGQQRVTLTITDRGIGMTPEQIERAFDRFYRADPSDAGIRGTGLGLSIVKYIVEAHDGSVSIDSWSGQGTSVVVTLPVY